MKKMTEDQLTVLIRKYLSGEATEEEKKQIEQWYESFDASSAEFAEGNTEKITDSIAGSLQAIKEKIAQKRAKELQGSTAPLYKIRTMHWWRIAAAAAMLILFPGVAYFLLVKTNKQQTNITILQVKKDIQPGGNKAILTLGNGRQIVLDSTHNGLLSMQGNMKVVKLNSGMLAYTFQSTTHRHQTADSRHQAAIQYNTISTPRGGQYQVILPDGSKVWLNAASSIRFPTAFTGKEREVQITGEAYFEVVKNAAMPFIVSVNGMTVEDLGTHFNIMAYSNEKTIKTTLLEGAVKVSFPPSDSNKGREALTLKPGQQAQLNNPLLGDEGLKLIKDVNVNEIVAWKNNLFWFDNDNIQAVMRKLSRWYDADVMIKGDIPDHFIGSIPRNVPISKVFEVLQKTGSIHYTIENGKIIVSP